MTGGTEETLDDFLHNRVIEICTAISEKLSPDEKLIFKEVCQLLHFQSDYAYVKSNYINADGNIQFLHPETNTLYQVRCSGEKIDLDEIKGNQIIQVSTKVHLLINGYWAKYLISKEAGELGMKIAKRFSKIEQLENYANPEFDLTNELNNKSVELFQTYFDFYKEDKGEAVKRKDNLNSKQILWIKSPDELISWFIPLLQSGTIYDPQNRLPEILVLYIFKVSESRIQTDVNEDFQPVWFKGPEKELLRLFADLIKKQRIAHSELSGELLTKICFHFRNKKGKHFKVKQLQIVMQQYGF